MQVLGENASQVGGPRVFQLVDLQVGGGHEVEGIHLGDDLLDEPQIVGTGRDHEGVAPGIDSDGHGIATGLAWDLHVGAAGSVHALLDQALEHGGHALCIGVLEDEGFQHTLGDCGFHVDAGEQVLDEVEVLFVGRDDERVVEAVGLDLHPVGGGGGLAGQGARLHAGGEDAFESHGDLGGVVVLEGQHGQGQRGVVELAIELLEQGINGLVVFATGGDHERIDASVGQDDRLLALDLG